MIERYLVVAGRIQQEIGELERVVSRVERAFSTAQRRPEDQDLYLDSVVLNLHDFYTGLERIFRHIAELVDRSIPSGAEWHRELLKQLGMELPRIRPKVLSSKVVKALDEYLRFRHVVRNIYAFELDSERIERLVKHLRPIFDQARTELLAFSDFLQRVVSQD